MPPIGPSLPAALSKRKRTPEADEGVSSPPYKLRASSPQQRTFTLAPSNQPPSNPEELDLENDTSEDDYGPTKPVINDRSSPAAAPTSKRVLGPALPPTGPISQNEDELHLESSSSEDDYGPSKLTKTKPKPPRTTTITTTTTTTTTPKRILGPAPPPAPLFELPPSNAEPPSPTSSSSSSSSSDDYGPSLPSLTTAHAASTAPNASALTTPPSPPRSKPQREAWMLIPPSANDTQRMDPTKLKSRKFASGKGASSQNPGGDAGISAIWTETPAEKRQRLEDEVLGRREVASRETGQGNGREEKRAREERERRATEERMRVYNERVRGRSLMDEHVVRGNSARDGENGSRNRSAGGKGDKASGKEREREQEQDDDPSRRAFDKEKDMALGGRLGHVQKREMLTKAKDFGGRFQKGSYL